METLGCLQLPRSLLLSSLLQREDFNFSSLRTLSLVFMLVTLIPFGRIYRMMFCSFLACSGRSLIRSISC